MQAALAGGKAKKKKWNKGKMREKINAKVLFDEDGWNRLQAEVPKVEYTLYVLIVRCIAYCGADCNKSECNDILMFTR